jgi:hypothetical protein
MPDDAWEKRNIRQNFYSCTPLASESFKKEIRKGSKRSEPCILLGMERELGCTSDCLDAEMLPLLKVIEV